MNRPPRPRPPRRQRGLALIEAVVALPVVLLVLIPVGEVVRAFVQYSILAHHTRSAVRYVAERAVNDTTGVPDINAALAAAAQNVVVYGSPVVNGTPVLPGLTISEVSPPVITTSGDVFLTVTHPYKSALSLGGRLPAFGFGADLTLADRPLTVSYTMRPL